MNDTPTSTAVPPTLEFGVNYPIPANWFGYWIGPWNYAGKPVDSASGPLWRSTLKPNLQKLRDQFKVRLIRMFLLCNGFNLGYPDNTADRLGNNWRPPTTLDPLYAEHLVELLTIFRDLEMKIIPSWISFEFFTQIHAHTVVVEDTQSRNLFIHECLGKLLDASAPFKDQIYAWEVINEPYHVQNNGYPFSSLVTAAPFTLFLADSVHLIDSKGFPSTVGHRWFSDLSTYPTGTRPQFHYYPHPLMEELPRHPNAILGEFGSETENQNARSFADNPWPECHGADKNPTTIIAERLKVLQRYDYKTVLVWPDLPASTSDTLKFTEAKLQAATRFLTTG